MSSEIHKHPLDNPAWSCLTTDHAHLAIGSGPVRRYLPDYSAFCAIEDPSDATLNALRDCINAYGPVAFPCPWDITPPDGIRITWRREVVQMVCEGEIEEQDHDFAIKRLSNRDAPEMVALADLTKPGPFAKRTNELGTFWGVRNASQLIAMAGERLRQPGFTEVSGICTHPDHQGRGLGIALTRRVCRDVIDRGEVPYLHAFSDNTSAIRLYEKLGFKVRNIQLIGFALEAA